MATSYAHFSKEVQIPPYTTDHWNKLKVKSLRWTQLPSGNVTILCAPKVPGIKHRRHSINIGEFERGGGAARGLSRAGSASLQGHLQDQLPPLYLSRHLSAPSVRSGVAGNRHITTAAGNRAKMGFKYWCNDPLETGNSGNGINKVTMGARGSYLGLGMPRL